MGEYYYKKQHSQPPWITNVSFFIIAKTAKRIAVTATNEGPRISLRSQQIYSPPDICGKEWQSKYQTLHQDIINNRREAKFLIYSCPWTSKGCCGYGNRVYAMVSLFYLAILTDRAFLINWKTPKPLERFLKPKGINWTFPIPNLETRKHYWRTGGHAQKVLDGWLTKNTSAVVSLIRKENFTVYFDKPVEIVASILYSVEHGLKKNKHLMQRARELKISPLLPGSQRYAMIGCAYDFLFNKSPRLQNALQNTRNALRSNNTFVIGIHIRLGDIQFGRNTTRVSESEFPKFFSCAKKVERKLFNLDGRMLGATPRQTRWFLAADSVLVKDYARKHFAEKVITAESKPEHLDLFKKGEKPPSDEGMLGVLHDHFMLAECDFLVLSAESSFSKTAVGLGMRSSKIYTFGENCDLKLKKQFYE